MSGYGLIEQLTAVIKYLMDYPQGLSMLLGRVPPPSCEDIEAMIETARRAAEQTLDKAGDPMRVDGGAPEVSEADRLLDSEDRWNRIIERAGGWEHIYEVVEGWRTRYPTLWKTIIEYKRYSKSRFDDISYRTIADELGINRDVVKKTIKDFPQRLATAILYTPVGDTFDLSSTLDKKAV